MNDYTETAERLAKLAVAGALVAYALGFLIISVHLGGLGTAPIELVRGRYVLVGSLFLVFLGSTWIPAALFYEQMLVDDSGSPRRRLYSFAAVTFRYYGLLTLAVFLLGRASTWPALFHPEPVGGRVAQAVKSLWPPLVGVGWVIMTNVAFRLVSSRRRGISIAQTLREGAEGGWTTGVFGLAFAFFIAGQRLIMPTNLSAALHDGWLRFLIVSFGSFAIGTSIGLMHGIGDIAPRSPEHGNSRMIRRVAVRSVMLLLIGAAYCDQVFPYLPLSLGGGLPVCARIEYAEASVELGDAVGMSGHEVRIIDRTEARVLFLQSVTPDGPPDVAEVPANRISRITACREKN